MMPNASLNSWICFCENREKMLEPDFLAFFDPVKLKMKSFVAVLACVASASAAVIPAAYNGYAYPYAYAAAPVAYAAAPVGGVYAGVYDASVAYANLYPAAEPYVHEEIAAEPYVDAQIAAEPYVHEEPIAVAAPVVAA